MVRVNSVQGKEQAQRLSGRGEFVMAVSAYGDRSLWRISVDQPTR
jgi:hypothetical protein